MRLALWACLNTYLRYSNPPIFTCHIEIMTKHQASVAGMVYLKSLGYAKAVDPKSSSNGMNAIIRFLGIFSRCPLASHDIQA